MAMAILLGGVYASRRVALGSRSKGDAGSQPVMKGIVQSFCLFSMLCLSGQYCAGQTAGEAPGSTTSAHDKPELVVQLGQGSSIDYVTFSPNGRSLLTANSSDSNAVLW